MKINTVNKFAYFFFGLIDCIIYILNHEPFIFKIALLDSIYIRCGTVN